MVTPVDTVEFEALVHGRVIDRLIDNTADLILRQKDPEKAVLRALKVYQALYPVHADAEEISQTNVSDGRREKR
jgi:hypothetical protein